MGLGVLGAFGVGYWRGVLTFELVDKEGGYGDSGVACGAYQARRGEFGRSLFGSPLTMEGLMYLTEDYKRYLCFNIFCFIPETSRQSANELPLRYTWVGIGPLSTRDI